MPKLPVLSGQALIRLLEQAGFEKVRQRGSHVIMRRAGLGCVVPLHKEVKAGTLVGILRQAGLTADDLINKQ